MTPAANGRRGHAACQKNLAEFADRRRQRSKIIFSRDMCVRENTSQAASVEFVRLWHTNYAHSRLQPFVGKTLRVFPTASMTPAANGRRGHVLFSVPAPPYKSVDRGSPPRRNRSSDRPPYAGKGPQPEDSVCSLRPPPRRSPVSCTRIIVFSFHGKRDRALARSLLLFSQANRP